jgi:hypothetical protein
LLENLKKLKENGKKERIFKNKSKAQKKKEFESSGVSED